MPKVIIEISDTPLGKTDIKCSVPWAELSQRFAKHDLKPGAESLAWVAINAIQKHTIAQAKKMFAKTPRVGDH